MSSSQLSGLKPVELPKESNSGLGASPIAITPRSKDDGERRWADFLERTEARDLKAIADKLAADKPAREFLTAAFDLSPYLADLARQHPQVIEVCHEQGLRRLWQAVSHLWKPVMCTICRKLSSVSC